MKDFLKQLNQILPLEQIKLGEPMCRHTTFRVGGLADYYVEPTTEEELVGIMKLCREESESYFILGNGSNLLVGDKGYRGVVIALGKGWSDIAVEEEKIRAGSGAKLFLTAKQACDHSLTGLEFAAGIPGTVGGAVVMNAGAYGSDMSGILEQVKVLTEAGQIQVLPVSQLRLGYRTSCIKECGYVVLEAEMKLQPGQKDVIQARMEELAQRRRSRQPLEYPSAGSTFKRPEGYFAGKLIEDAGLGGFRIGGAEVSAKHCGFIINRGNASAADVLNLCCIVQQKVKEQFGVHLEMEVKVLGEF